MAFPGARRCTCCIYCFGVIHSSADCIHAYDNPSTNKGSEINCLTETPRSCYKINKEWNFTPMEFFAHTQAADSTTCAGIAPETLL